jgi:hypothetical protein
MSSVLYGIPRVMAGVTCVLCAALFRLKEKKSIYRLRASAQRAYCTAASWLEPETTLPILPRSETSPPRKPGSLWHDPAPAQHRQRENEGLRSSPLVRTVRSQAPGEGPAAADPSKPPSTGIWKPPRCWPCCCCYCWPSSVHGDKQLRRGARPPHAR